jgi:hypothetical protein
VSSGILSILGDVNLVNDTIEFVDNEEDLVELWKLVSDDAFIAKLGEIENIDDLAKKIIDLVSNGSLLEQLKTLATNPDIRGKVVEFVIDLDVIAWISLHLGQELDFSGDITSLIDEISTLLEDKELTDLLVGLCENSEACTAAIAFLKDVDVTEKIKGLFASDKGFAETLGGLMEDCDFIQKICTAFGLDEGIKNSLVSLFGGDKDFFKQVEELLGEEYSGKLTKILGNGSFKQWLISELGDKSFNELCIELGVAVVSIASVLQSIYQLLSVGDMLKSLATMFSTVVLNCIFDGVDFTNKVTEYFVGMLGDYSVLA